MRILMVNDYPLTNGWGAEVLLSRLMRELRATGDDVEVFAPNQPRTGAAKVLDFWDPSARKKLRERVAEYRPDVVHFHNFQRELSASVLGAVGVAKVLTIHDHGLFGDRESGNTGWRKAVDNLKPVKARLDRTIARRTMDAVIAPSVELVQRLLQAGFREIHHVPNFVEAGPEPDSPPSASVEIVYVGRVSTDKGVTDLIEAFRRIGERHPDAVLTIVGSGVELETVKSSVPGSVASRVSFIGRLEPGEVRNILIRARLLCLPSRLREGSPLTAIEAALAGRPVVVSDTPGLRAMVEEAKFGIVAAATDVEAIASGLDRLLSDPEAADRLGAAGRTYALGRWTTENGLSLTRAAYARAIERASGSSGR